MFSLKYTNYLLTRYKKKYKNLINNLNSDKCSYILILKYCNKLQDINLKLKQNYYNPQILVNDNIFFHNIITQLEPFVKYEKKYKNGCYFLSILLFFVAILIFELLTLEWSLEKIHHFFFIFLITSYLTFCYSFCCYLFWFFLILS
jgi:hypothetical protein